METLYVTAAKYIFVLLMAVYTWECFSALKTRKERKTARIFHRQNAIIFIVCSHFFNSVAALCFGNIRCIFEKSL